MDFFQEPETKVGVGFLFLGYLWFLLIYHIFRDLIAVPMKAAEMPLKQGLAAACLEVLDEEGGLRCALQGWHLAATPRLSF